MLKGFTHSKNVWDLLHNIHNCSTIDEKCGVYAVVYKKNDIPDFKDPGSGPEIWDGRKVNVSVGELADNWITFKNGDEHIIYIGRAGGENTKTNLKKRIRKYILFGLGNKVAHYGGRYIWQIGNFRDLEINWEPVDRPAEIERNLLDQFKKEHNQRLPFANLKSGDKLDISKIINNPIFASGIILPSNSVHGLTHWKRVEKFGLKIAKKNGADKKVISLFAYLHDARRENECDDPAHGARSVILLKELLDAKIISLTSKQYEQLVSALSLHNKHNAKSNDITVQTCWDADRLDLWRCGFVPNPELMFSGYGKSKKMIEYAKKLNNISLY